MYITLSQIPDRDGFQGQVVLNVDKINGFREVAYKDIGGNSQKDEAGYVGTYTEVLMRGCNVVVTEPMGSLLRMIQPS